MITLFDVSSQWDVPEHPARLRFGLLGPFEAWVGDKRVPIGGAAERSLLAVLLLSAGRTVAAASLVDRLWAADTLPRDPMNALQIRVSKLRRALSGTGLPVVHRDSVGYRVEVPAEAIDSEAFVHQLRTARREVAGAGGACTERHLDAFDRALSLWRGEALADFATEPWAFPEASRLTELRRSAIAERAEVALSLGRSAEVVADLDPLVTADPTQEAMAALLMVALYRQGRQADALEIFNRTRTMLDDELGLEPSASLRSLHQQVLRQDEALGAATRMPLPPAPAPGRPRGSDSPTNLPPVLAPLVGRDNELASLRELLIGTRLATLVGPGGAGKTTLAVATAVALRDSFPDGVFLARLAPVAEGDQVSMAVADALGVPLDGAPAVRDARERLIRFLEHRRLLLVIDNCEHLVEAAATLVEELSSRCPDLTILTTSREALAIPGEVQVLVGPLATPAENATPQEVRSSPAAQLFLRRAAAYRPQLAHGPDELLALGRVCRALDGMPLALELAAARVTSLSVTEIADRLDQRFALLTTGTRTAEDRQRTLRATVDWSHDLLDGLQRTVFARLSVFHGGWDLGAAERIVTSPELSATQVLQALGRLVEQSLVVAEPGRTTRYVLLETLREYAAERLTDSGSADEVARRHATYYATVVADAADRLRGPGQREALRLLRSEHPNVRAALSWLAGPGDSLDEALELAGRLGLFWHLGRHVEGREVLERLLAAAAERQGRGAQPSPSIAQALGMQALSLVERPRACIVHPSPRCAEAARESLEQFHQLGDRSSAALSKVLLAVEGVLTQDDESAALLDTAEDQFRADGDEWGLGVVGFVRMERALQAGHVNVAVGLGRTAALAFRQLDDLWGLSAVLYHLGWGLRQFGHYDQAVGTLTEAIDVAAEAGLDNTVQWALGDLGIAHVCRGDLPAARDAFVRAARTSAAVGDGAGTQLATYGHGLLDQAAGRWDAAREHFAAAARGFASLGTPVMHGYALLGAARADEARGDITRAEAGFQAVLELHGQAGEPALLAGALEGLGRLNADEGQRARAREVREAAHRPPAPYELIS